MDQITELQVSMDIWRSMLERQTLALERLAALMDGYMAAQKENRPKVYGRGFGKNEESPMMLPLVYVGRKSGKYFYTVVDQKVQLFDADYYEATFKSVQLIYKPAKPDARPPTSEAWKLRILGLTDEGYRPLEFGATTGFCRCVVDNLLGQNPEIFRRPILIAPKLGESAESVLATLYDGDGNHLRSERRDTKGPRWSQIWPHPVYEFIKRVHQANGQPFNFRSAEEFYEAIKSGEVGTTNASDVSDDLEEDEPEVQSTDRPFYEAHQPPVIDQFKTHLAQVQHEEDLLNLYRWILAPPQWNSIKDVPAIAGYIQQTIRQRWQSFGINLEQINNLLGAAMADKAWTKEDAAAYVAQKYNCTGAEMSQTQKLSFLLYLRQQPSKREVLA